MRNFFRSLPMKLYILIAAVLAFSFFSNDFGLVDIQKTAVILAAGIDRTENGFSLTAQIAVPKGSDRTAGGTSSVEIEAEGETVSDCVSLIFSKTGWVPKLVFCDLIVLGEDAVKEDVIAYLNYFLRNDYMPDSCMLAVCEGKAGELISTVSAIDDASSLAISKLFSDAAKKSGKVMPCTLKDFAIGYYGVSESGYLPFIRTERQKGGQNDSLQSAGAGTGTDGEQKIYIAEETALFSKGKMVGLLDRNETLAVSLLKGNVFSGTFNAMDGDKPVTLSVVNNRGKVSLDSRAPSVKLSLSVVVRLCCRGVTAAIDDIASDRVTDDILKSCKETLSGYVGSMWEKLKGSGCDLFFLRRALYRSSPKRYGMWKDDVPFLSPVTVEANVRSMK